MASIITEAIGLGSFERIRDRIGQILADELPNQATLHSDNNLRADVYIERFHPPSNADCPMVSVCLSNSDYDRLTRLTQHGTHVYNIDVFTQSRGEGDEPGDKLASVRLQKLVNIIRAILSHNKYNTLAFAPPFIENTIVESIKIGTPMNKPESSNMVMSRIKFVVKGPDNSDPIIPVDIDGYISKAVLGLTDKGYLFGGDAFLPPVEPECSPVTITRDGEFLETVESGGTFNFDTNCDPVDININGIDFSNPESGSTANISVVDENSNQVGIKVDELWQVPSPKNTSELFKTGANIVYQSGDDGDMQQGAGADFFTLDYNNGFGNLNRFTDDLGTQLYANGVLLDWSTFNRREGEVLGYGTSLLNSSSLTNHINGQPYTLDAHSDWNLCNYNQLVNIFNMGIRRNYLNYSPFNHNVSSSANRVWCNTRDNSSVGIFYSGSAMTVGNHSGSYKAIIQRTYTLTELDL